MFRRLASHHEDEDRKDIFAPVADLMVGVVFIFIILMIALSLNLQSEDRVPKADYDARVAEIQMLRQQFDATRKELEAAEQRAAKLADDNARLVDFARFVRDRSIVPLMDRLSRADQTRTEILSDMRRRLNDLGVDVTVNAEAGTIALPSRNLFASGRSDPTPEGRDTIFKLGSVMADVLPCYTAGSWKASGCPTGGEFSRLGAVYVEGHTDIVPYGTPSGRFRNNWDLSAGRAIEAYTILRTQYERIRDLHNADGQALVGVSGYADTRPADPVVADRSTVQIMDKDRRIEVRLLMTANAEMVGSVLRDLKQQLESVRELVR
jgi:chemotaxis protein MotB